MAFNRDALTTLRNNDVGKGIFLPRRSPSLDGMLADGYVTFEVEGKGFRYRLTEAGDKRLLDRSDITPEQSAAIVRQALKDHDEE